MFPRDYDCLIGNGHHAGYERQDRELIYPVYRRSSFRGEFHHVVQIPESGGFGQQKDGCSYTYEYCYVQAEDPMQCIIVIPAYFYGKISVAGRRDNAIQERKT